jgi:hypothetical protein
MTETNKFITPYTFIMELGMQHFYNSLNEKDKRRYAGIEASKLDHGGISYIAELFNCSRQTVSAGLEEIKKKFV